MASFYRQPPAPVHSAQLPAPFAGTMTSANTGVAASQPVPIRSEDWFLDGGPKNRLVLALESGLPNEVDWAFNKLVHFTFVCPNEFSLAHLPPLTDALLDHAQPFFDWVHSSQRRLTEGKKMPALLFATHEHMLSAEQIERLLQIMHILRNMSFLESNLQILLSHPGIARLVECTLMYSDPLPTNEVKRHALEIYENLSPRIKLRGFQDKLFLEVQRLLFSEDRCMVVGAIRSLTHLCAYPPNEPIFKHLDKKILERFWTLLLTGDESIVSEIMEFLYQYTNYFEDGTTRVAESSKTNVVRLLIKFLMWRGSQRHVQPSAPRSAPKPAAQESASHEQPAAPPPPSEMQMSAEMKQCSEWWKEHYVIDVHRSTDQIQLYYKYLNSCKEQKVKPIPLAEFFRVAFTIAFAGQLKLEVKMAADGKQVVFVRGIRSKDEPATVPAVSRDTEAMEVDVPMSEAAKEAESPCQWRGCRAKLKSDTTKENLLKHILNVHLNEKQPEFQCCWKHCERFNDGGVSRSVALAHFQQHVPRLFRSEELPARPAAPTHSSSLLKPIFDARDPAVNCGIPFTAALVLRNMARKRENRLLFYTFERDIAYAMAMQGPNDGISKVLASLLAALCQAEVVEEPEQ